MRFPSIHNLERQAPWLIAVLAFAAYATRLLGHSLLNDEGKHILNLPYPHPPLVRAVMAFFSDAFGGHDWAGRIPSAVLGAGGVAIVYLLLRRASVRPWIAALSALAYAFMSPSLVWAPTGFLSVPLVFFLLLGLLGASEISLRPDRSRGWWIMSIGFGLGLWTELQSVSFVPVYAYVALRHRAVLLRDRKLAAIWLLGVFQGVLLSVYVAGNPLIVGELTSEASLSGLKPSLYMICWLIAVGALFVLSILYRRKLQMLYFIPTLILAIALILIIRHHPAAYYAPYLALFVPLLAAPLAESAGRRGPFVLAALLIPCFLIPSQGIDTPAFDRFIREYEPEWRTLLRDEKEVIVIGKYGYEIQYYLPAAIRKLPRDLTSVPDAHYAFVFRGQDLSPEERAFVASLKPVATWGVVHVYHWPAE